MPLRSIALAIGIVLSSLAAQAQLRVPPGTNLFAGEERSLAGNGADSGNPDAQRTTGSKGIIPSPSGYESTLVFQNDQQLRGIVVSIDRDDVMWRRPDVSEVMRIPRTQVRSIVFDSKSVDESETDSTEFEPPQSKSGNAPEAEQRLPATVKMAGLDWLRGGLTSLDGETFRLELNKSAAFTISRGQVQWAYFGLKGAPCGGFCGSESDIEGWHGSGGISSLHVEKGVLIGKEGTWMGRTIPFSSRFEMSFAVPGDSEQNTDLWLQPWVYGPNCYGRGTVELTLSPTEISRCIYTNKMDRKTEPLPAEAKVGDGLIRYRILYDKPGDRLIVLRNGRRAGEWKLGEPDPNRPQSEQERGIRSICFNRKSGEKSGDIRLSLLDIRPWNGAVPGQDESSQETDWLSTQHDPPEAGNLQKVTETSVEFSGKDKKLCDGSYLEFHSFPVEPIRDDCRVSFGSAGDLGASELRIADGVVRFRSNIGASLSLPAGALVKLSFPGNHVQTPKSNAVLIFLDGDELDGELVAANSAGRVRWRLPTGQEVEFSAEHICGISFNSESPPSGGGKGARIETTDGDQLFGELLLLDKQRVNFRNGEFGSISLPINRVKNLYPVSRDSIYDSRADPGAMFGGEKATGFGLVSPITDNPASSWICLDGAFVPRNTVGRSNWQESAEMNVPQRCLGDRYELSCDVEDSGGGTPSCTLNMRSREGENGMTSVTLTISTQEITVVSWDQKLRRGQNFQNFSIADKLINPASRMNLRLFVNSAVGTLDAFVDGIPVYQMGRRAPDRLPGYATRVQFQANLDGAPVVISNIKVTPWSGDLRLMREEPRTVLQNGDASLGAIERLTNGKLLLESEIGPVAIPIEKVSAIHFGHAADSPAPAGRIVLGNGTLINVDRFHTEGEHVLLHSEVLGEVKLPIASVLELIVHPNTIRSAHALCDKKAVKSERAGDADAEQKAK